MHIALIGSTGAGKTTLARGIVQSCRDRGLAAWLSEEFAAREIGIDWIRVGFLRRRVLELASILYCLANWRRYQAYHTLAFRLVREAPGSLLYKAGLLRLTLRKTGIHEILRRRLRSGQVVVSDNEATLQGAHHLFVHPKGTSGLAKVGTFASMVPLPDVVVHMRTPERIVVERTLARGHRRLGTGSAEAVATMAGNAAEVFDRLCAAPALDSRLLVVEEHAVVGDEGSNGCDGGVVRMAAELVSTGMDRLRESTAAGEAADERFTLAPEIARQLIERLNHGVSYSHWKSNFSLARGHADDGDLDLLVSPSSLLPAQQILAELGYKEALVQPGPRTPGVWHYYGCDRTTGALVHVHLFSRVVTGESFVKSHRLPLDSMLLENLESIGTVRVPSRSAELVLFVLRTFIKYGSLPDLLRLARGRDSVRAELRWLEARAAASDALSLLDAHCPRLGGQLFLECLAALHNDRSLVRRVLLAFRVRWRLRVYAVRSPLRRLLAYVWFVAAHARTKMIGSGKRRAWHSGGTVIAFVGPDATGKSTMTGETTRWLRSACSVKLVHLGKPRPSLRTLPLNGLLVLLRSFRRRRRRWEPASLPKPTGNVTSEVKWSSLVYAVRAVALAFDRRQAVRRAWLAATRGEVVVCDRYPTIQVGAMDGPRLHAGSDARGLLAGLYARLARIELELYRGIPSPDVLIRLTVSLETARQRNRDREKADKHSDEDLERRHQALGTWSTSRDRRWDVSTEGSVGDALLTVKRAIWEAL